MRTVMWSPLPLGAVLGGLVATALGLRPTLWICAAGYRLSSLWLVIASTKGSSAPGPGPVGEVGGQNRKGAQSQQSR